MTSELFQGRAPRLWLRLEQHADKPYYAQTPPTLADGYILNSNLVESAPDACASFLDQTGKPFLIDPVTYRFDRAAWYTRLDAQGEPLGKRNYARLWAKYSDGVGGLSGDPLRDGGLGGLKGEQAIVRFCQNVINFQEERLRSVWAQDGAQYVVDRLPFVGQLAPAAYVTPYPVIGASEPGPDIELAGALARATATLARPRPVVAVLPLMPHVSRDLGCLRSLAATVAESGVQAALVWTVGTSALELADDPALFTGVALLLRNLRDAGLQGGLLYGGILSSLLRGFGAASFSHGLMYGEVRGLEPSGGRPQLTFYFPPLRHPLSYAGAAQIVMAMSPAEYLERVCGCAVCAQLVAGDIRNLGAYFQTYRPDGAKRDFPTQEALDLNRFHYLLARGAELEFVRARPEGQLIADLLAAADPYPPSESSALRRWAKRLRAA